MSDEKLKMHEPAILDCKGLACPQPVILTKKAIDRRPEALTVIVDNPVARENVAKFATASGYGVSIEETEGLYRLRLLAGPTVASSDPAAAAAAVISAGERPVFLLTKQTLGQGDDQLGAILMKAFFVSLLETSPQPQSILLINSGVFLAAQGSPVLPAMQELDGRGVNILVCGTCLDFFNLKENLAVGSVTNMFSILKELTGAGRAITL